MSIDWIPARKIPSKERGNRGFIPSIKNPNGVIEYESCLERDFYLLANHAPSVRRIQHQPIRIAYIDKNGKRRHYTPDSYIEYWHRKPGIYEVKYESDIIENERDYEEKWNAAEKWAEKNGAEFAVLTEHEIRTARKENVWLTLGASKCSSNNKYMGKLKIILPPGGIEYNAFCKVLSEELGVEIGKAAQIICYAIYHGEVFIDTFSTKQIASDTIIRPSKIKDSKPFKPLWEELELSGELDHDTEEDTSLDEDLLKLSTKPPSEYEEEIERRLEIVKAYLAQPSNNRTPEWRDEFFSNYNTSKSSIYRWIKSYEEDGIDGLVPKHEQKGRKMKYDKKTIELVEKARKFYIRKNRSDITLKKAFRKLKAICKEEKIKCPPRSYLEWYIYQNTSQVEFAQRYGRRYQKSFYTPSLSSFQGANIPMQILQFDNSPHDTFTVDEEERNPMRTPYLTAAIDVDTRIITGFSLSYFPPSRQSVLEVLVQSILPKQEFTSKYQTEFNWPLEGFPVLILTDNGMDYRANDVREFCKKYDIILEHAPIRTPRYKAIIEQWFEVLRKALFDEEVDGTRPPLYYRLRNPDLTPEEEAIFTLQEIETWMHKWVVDGYHFTNQYNDHVPAPYLRLKKVKDGQNGLILPSPRDPPNRREEIDMLHFSTLDTFKRTLQDYGVVWEHLKYNSKELGKIYKIYGKTKVKVLMDRRDIRHLWVISPVDEKPIRVELASGWAQEIARSFDNKPIHKSAWKTEVDLIKQRTEAKITPYLYRKQKSRDRRKALIDGAKKKASKTSRNLNAKQKEASRKSITKKIQPPSPTERINTSSFKKIIPKRKNVMNFEEKKKFKKIIPKGLPTSKYPSKT